MPYTVNKAVVHSDGNTVSFADLLEQQAAINAQISFSQQALATLQATVAQIYADVPGAVPPEVVQAFSLAGTPAQPTNQKPL